ncbi:MAG: efflux RND transporter periplasmic adaptor subunit [Paucibacter sp.]|nr:efflux RND transporter periplasmic adaptor subunit [Roseateles sp.]
MSSRTAKVRALLRKLRWWLAAAILIAAWRVYAHVTAPPPPVPPTGDVKQGDIVQTVQAAGTLQAKTKVDVGARASGQIKEIPVVLGQAVKKGDLLVLLDPELAQSDVLRAEASVAQQRASLDARRVDLDAARREMERQRRLLKGEATAANDAEKAVDDYARLEADVRGQAANLAQLQAQLDTSKLNLGYTRITAPMDGVVVNINVQVGQTVIAVQTTPVMVTLADLDTITVRTKVPEADVQSLAVGQKASFATLSGDGRRYEGKLRVIQPIPERAGNAVFYNALFEVDNRDRKLFNDMTVQVDVETGEAKKTLTMPIVALGERSKDGAYAVTVVGKDGKNESRQVRTGLHDAGKVQVLSGVKAGEKVLLAPSAASAPDGATVTVS